MPSTAIQSRISAFESLNSSSPLKSPSLKSPSLNTPSSYPKSLNSPSFPQKPLSHKPPPPKPVSRSPSPPNLGRKTSLIDLKDWIVDDGPSSIDDRTPTQHQFVPPLINLESPPRPKPTVPAGTAPPLPPRKPSYTSLKSVASSLSSHSVSASPHPSHRSDSLTVDHHTYPPLKIDADSHSRNTPGHAPASSISSFHSVSLSSDTDPTTPGSATFISTYPMDRDPELKYASEADTASLADSYEEVSTPSVASPVTERIISLDWEKAMARRKQVPPKLPQRPSPTLSFSSTSIHSTLNSPPLKPQSTSSSAPGSPAYRASLSSPSPSSTLGTGSLTRKPPPPPPSRSSDRSSILSTATSYSASSNSHSSQGHSGYSARSINSIQLKSKRPTPVPPAARVRYESVFNANVIQQRKAEKQKAKEKPTLLSPAEARGTSRRAAGWRGLSVDLITGGNDEGPPQDDDEVSEVVGPTDKLEGRLIKTIWRRSRLGRRTLGAIWHECDPDGTGSLMRDQFAKGMWRVDEELRRAQIQALKSTSATSLGSQRSRAGYNIPPPLPKHKPILR
ncbi:hypothetical protein C0991_002415 [Blastosporella zonata]|nr:hypothetical protein C0991_002415 [Blastosporella zonata]